MSVNFPTQSSLNDEVPGCLIPAIPDGVPARQHLPECAALDCPKRLKGNVPCHKGWRGYTVGKVSSYKREKPLFDMHNAIAEKLRQIQALIDLSWLAEVGIPQFASEYSVGGYPVYTTFEWPVQSVSTRMIVATYTPGSDNDPRHLDRHNYKATLCGGGVAKIGNTKLVHPGAICYATDILTATNQIRFHLATPLPGRITRKADGALPQTVSFTCFWGLALPIRTKLKDAYPMWVRYEEVTLAIPETPGVMVVIEGQRIQPDWDNRIEKQVGGEWVDTGRPVTMVRSGSWYNAVADLTGLDLTGSTGLRAVVRTETEPSEDLTETITREVSVGDIDPLAADYPRRIIEVGGKADILGAITYEAMVWDSGYVWMPWLPWEQIENIETADWYDVNWPLTLENNTFEWIQNEGDPPIPIEAVRATFVVERKNDDALHAPCGDRCKWSTPDYSKSVGLLDGNAKWHCYWWPDLTTDEQTHYAAVGPKCMNTACQHFEVDYNIRETLQAVSEACYSVPYRKEYLANSSTSFTFNVNGAPSLLFLSGQQLDATGRNWGKIEWGYGRSSLAGWQSADGKKGLENWDGEDGLGMASKAPITRGPVARHRQSGALDGEAGRAIVHRETTLVFADLDQEIIGEWQKRADGDAMLCWVDAQGNVVAAGTTGATQATMIHADRLRPLKDASKRREAAVVKSGVRIHSISGSGPFTADLRHKATYVGKPYITGEGDTVVTVYTGGTNVLLPPTQRPTNNAAPEAVVGKEAWGYIRSSGCCLLVPDDARLPAWVRGKRLPITAAAPCAGANDPAWDDQLALLEGVGDMGDLDMICKMDRITFAEENGVWAAVAGAVDVTTLTFDVVEGPLGLSAGTWTGSYIDVTDYAITGVEAWPSSGHYWIPGWHKCLIGDGLEMAEFLSAPSVTHDLNPLYQSLVKMWGC